MLWRRRESAPTSIRAMLIQPVPIQPGGPKLAYAPAVYSNAPARGKRLLVARLALSESFLRNRARFPLDVAPPRRLPSKLGGARCTGHLGGRHSRQRTKLRNLFAWDLVDPVAYRPIPLASLDIIAAPRRNSCPKTPFLQRRRFRQTLRRLGRIPAPDPGGCYCGSMRRLRAPSSAEAPPT